MEDFKKRLIVERDELVVKLAKLESFIESPRFKGLDETNGELLIAQFEAMRQYYAILNMRISILL